MTGRIEELPGAKVVRVTGQLCPVPELELTDPHRDSPSGGCGAYEPDWPSVPAGAVCTLDPHDPRIMHIAHDGDGDVIAMWDKPGTSNG
jgi:hypothetical protein